VKRGKLNKNKEKSATTTCCHKMPSALALVALAGVGWLVGSWLVCSLALLGR
jgi:hypothetical protein